MRSLVVLGLLLAACSKAPPPAVKDEAPLAATPIASGAPVAPGAVHLGAPIEASVQKVSLADVAKTPDKFVNQTFTTTGTVTAVCQHMGCWMEIKDDASAAHVKMAGHAFFVPKTASGRKARVLAKLVKSDDTSCEGEGHEGMSAQAGNPGGEKKGCRAEAEDQLGRPLANLELEAAGVELM